MRDTELNSSISKGLACVARAYDGNSFDDEYLRFEYPGEAVESPLAGYRLTYRVLDAYFIVLMIRQAGVPPGEARNLFDRAETVTAALAPLWRLKGIYNLRRNPAHGGIALDTYAILAVLRRDSGMGRVVEAGLDGDGWLPASYYVVEEAFRRLADESWAVRALLVSDPLRGLEALRALCGQATRALGTEPDPVARANLVIHALGALGDLPPSLSATAGAGGHPFDAEIQRLREEGFRLLRVKLIRQDTLTFGNLLGALLSGRTASDESFAPDIDQLMRRQGRDGCWTVSSDVADSSGRVFATLRVVLTLGQYEQLGSKRE